MTAGQGIVYLVGAGPGDPKLLTLRALELMRSADVAAYDELVPPQILSLVPAQAELLAVGRRHGHGKTEYRLHPMVLERARAGRIVVRLKSGDPLIFGRGAEEAEELAEAGIPFEIVPGVSAALGAAAYAGIPLTDRRYASQVTLATGHYAEGDVGNSCETLVLYMAAHQLAENLQRLIAQGRAPSTPAAYVAAATTPEQRVISGTLADLAKRVASEHRSSPALVIVGDVVALRERIQWFERVPLRGRRVLVARARPGRSKIASQLRALGAQVMESPSVSVKELDDYSALDLELVQLDRFDAIVFGCAAGVDAVARRLNLLNLKLDRSPGTAVIAVGEEATAAIERTGILPTLSLDGACHDAVAGSAPDLTSKHMLLIVAAQGRPRLQTELEALGATVEAVSAYRYAYEFARLNECLPEMILLPSSSAARLVLTGETGTSLTGIPMLTMGPATEAAARRHGAIDVTQCPADNVESLVSSAIEFLGRHPLSETLHRANSIPSESVTVFPSAWRRGVYEAITRRRDIRSFRSDLVPPDTLARILSAAHQAGSVGFSQPWNFIVIDDLEIRKEIRRHVEAERLRAATAFPPERREKYLSFKLEGILDAPLNICITCDRKRFGPAVLGRNTMHDTDVYSTCAAIQNLWLAARAEGIGVGWVSLLQPDALREMLGIPSDVVVVAYLCLGFPEEFPKRPMLDTAGWLPRLPLTELVFRNHWNEAPSPELSRVLGIVDDEVMRASREPFSTESAHGRVR